MGASIRRSERLAIVALALPVGCGAPGAPVAPVVARAPPPASTTPAPTARPAQPPAETLLWLHVQRPSIFLPVVRQLLPAMRGTKTWPRGFAFPAVEAWLDTIDGDAPFDFVVAAPILGSRPQGVRFAVRSLDAFLEAVAKQGYEATEEANHRIRLGGTGAPSERDAVCDLSSLVSVVCESDEGVAELTPRLRAMSSLPGARDDEVRLEVSPAGLSPWLPSELAQSAMGGTLLLSAGSNGNLTLDLLTHPASTPAPLVAEPTPDTVPAQLGRVPGRAFVAVTSRGGAPGAALLRMIAASRGRLAEDIRAAERPEPWSYGVSLDVDGVRAAAAALRSPTMNVAALVDELRADLAPYTWHGTATDVAVLEQQNRHAASMATIARDGPQFVVSPPDAALHLPARSFVVRMRYGWSGTLLDLYVPDGPVTWDITGGDEERLGRFAMHLLATPFAPRPGPGTEGSSSMTVSLWDSWNQPGPPWSSLYPLPSFQMLATQPARTAAANALDCIIAAPPALLRASVSPGPGGPEAHVTATPAVAADFLVNDSAEALGFILLFSMLSSDQR